METGEATRLYEDQRHCEECGEPFWGSSGAACCSPACYAKRLRAKKARTSILSLADVCSEVLARRESGSHSYSKLLPRLFRQAAVELRRRGWDPIELLLSVPDEPACPGDMAPGGITCRDAVRRRWLHPPDREIQILLERIALRKAAGKSVEWHERRVALLVRVVQGRGT
jgi:hypothetical protein